MTRIFLEILNMSISACWIIAAVLVLRAVFAKRMPKWISCCLWGLVALRLLVPFTFESSISLVPNERIVISDIKQGQGSASTDAEVSVSSGKEDEGGISPEGSDIYFGQEESGIVTDNSPQQPESDNSVQMNGYAPIINADDFSAPEPSGSIALNTDNGADLGGNAGIDDKESGISAKTAKILSSVWLCGVAAMLLYSLISFVALKRRVMLSIPCGDMVRKGECVESPFVFGLLKPRIYLPFGLSAQTEQCVIAHERAHLKRRDHLIKPLGFLLLSVYWFNPLVWVAYILLCRDIEFACDEKVISTLAPEERKTYAYALLECAVAHRRISACPVAFGETGVKERVKNTMKYRRPALWIIIASILVCALVTAPFITTSATEIDEDSKASEGFEVSQDSVEESIEESFEESLEASTEESFEESLEASTEESFEESISDESVSDESIPEESIPEESEPESDAPEQNEPEQNEPVINTPQSNGKVNVVGKTLGAVGASQGDWIYYVEGNQFFKINQNTYKSETIFILPMGWASNLNVVGDWLYFSVPETTDESAYIGKVRTDGRDFQKIVYTNDVWEVLVIGETVYYTSTNNPYTVWAKDVAPLYSVSVNGGAVTQVHDGSVENLVADENYIYFQYREKDGGKRSFVRMNHNATSRQTLWINELVGTEIDSFGFAVSEGRIYFAERYDNSETYRTVSSISINGGDYVAHFRANLFSSSLWAKNGKIYFGGVAPEYRDGYIGEYGDLSLTEYDMASGRFTALYDEWQYFYPTNEMLVVPEMHALWLYDYDSKTFTKVLLYV